MQTDFIINYFIEQKTESVIMMSIGILSILFALFFLFIIKYVFFKGLATSLLIAGVLQIYIGFQKLNKAYEDYDENFYLIRHSKNSITEIIIPNLEYSLNNSIVSIYAELAFIIIGLVIFFSLKKITHTFWKGLFLGLIISSFICLSLDLVSKHHIEKFEQDLKKYN